MQTKNYMPNYFSKRITDLFIGFFCVVTLIGCDELREEDLSGLQVKLIAPGDSLRTENSTQNFYWEELPGAEEYQLRIVEPGFDQIRTLVLDSIIRKDNFSFNLTPGDYQWGVRAINEGSRSNFSIRTLSIDSSLNLSGSTPVLIIPEDNDEFNDMPELFRWRALFNVDVYNFRIVKGSGFESGDVVYDTALSSTETAIPSNIPSDEGTYYWGVQGENEISKSQWGQRVFTIDKTPLPVPVLISPLDNAAEQSPVLFEWEAGNLPAPNDTLFVAADTAGSNIVQSAYSDSARSRVSVNSGTYYWFVKRTDNAGNSSVSNEIRTIIVQ